MGKLTVRSRRSAPSDYDTNIRRGYMPVDDPAAEGVFALGESVAGMADVSARRAIQLQEEENALTVSKALSAVRDMETEEIEPLLELQGREATEREGHDRGVFGEAEEIYRRRSGEIQAEFLQNDAQRQSFVKHYMPMEDMGLRAMARHYSQQHQVLKESEFEGARSNAKIKARRLIGDTAGLETLISGLKDQYRDLHPGVNVDNALNNIDSELRIEYLIEVAKEFPKALPNLLEKWSDKIPAETARRLENIAEAEDDKQQVNREVALAFQAYRLNGEQEAVKAINESTMAPDLKSKAQSILSAMIGSEENAKKRAEAEARNAAGLSMFEAHAAGKLTVDMILASPFEWQQKEHFLNLLKTTEDRTKRESDHLLLEELIERVDGLPGAEPIEDMSQFNEYLHENRKDGRGVDETKVLSLAKEWSGQKVMEAKTEASQKKANRREAVRVGELVIEGFAADEEMMLIDKHNKRPVKAEFREWVQMNPDATYDEIVDKAKGIGVGTLYDRWGWTSDRREMTSLEALSVDIGRGDVKSAVARMDPDLKNKIEQVLSHANHAVTDRNIWNVYRQWGEAKINQYVEDMGL